MGLLFLATLGFGKWRFTDRALIMKLSRLCIEKSHTKCRPLCIPLVKR
jgi:hypothetical protein